MGCASSSPLINGGGPGGIVEAAKETATKTANEVLQAGETAIHGVGEHVKDAMKNVTSEIEGVLGGKQTSKESSDHINENDIPQTNGHDQDGSDYQIIPLKDIKQSSVDESLENIKNNLLKKAQSFSDDTEKMADDIIKETEDLIRDAETGIEDHANEITTRITSSADGTIEILNLEEPEIERILDNDPKCPPTPEATMNSLMSSSDGAATESEAGDSTAAVVDQQQQKSDPGHDDSKREATDASSSCENTSSDTIVNIGYDDNYDNDTGDAAPLELQQTETTTEVFENVLSPELAQDDVKVSESALSDGEDDSELSEAEQQRRDRIHHFTFQLNSIKLSIIEEKTDDDSSVNQQSPEKAVVTERYGKSREESVPSLEGDDEVRKNEVLFRADSEGNENLISMEDDEIAGKETNPVDNEDGSSERSLKGFEDVEMLLDKMPPVTKLETFTRFRSFDYQRSEQYEVDSDEEEASLPLKKISLRDFKSKMQSESNLDILEGDDDEDGEEGADDDTIVPDEPEDGFDVDAALEEVLAETSPKVQKAKWEMLKRTLHKIPYRANSFDLFSESDEDILDNLFEQKRNKLLNNADEE